MYTPKGGYVQDHQGKANKRAHALHKNHNIYEETKRNRKRRRPRSTESRINDERYETCGLVVSGTPGPKGKVKKNGKVK